MDESTRARRSHGDDESLDGRPASAAGERSHREAGATATGADLGAVTRRYSACLVDYLAGPRGAEEGLESAYSLGRSSIALGLGVLDMVIIHQSAVDELLPRFDEKNRAVLALRAGDFLAECLGPFEILHRGYREQAVELRRLNEALQQRAAELAAANELIENLSRARSAFLAEAGRRLAGSLDFEATLRVVADLPVPAIADWCAVDLLEEDGELRRVAVSQRKPPASAVPCPVPGCDELVPQVVHDGTARVVESSPLAATVVPLAARERAFGALTLATLPPGHGGAAGAARRRAGMEELQLAEEFGRRAAIALENARLYREAQRAIQVRDDFLSIASHELKTPLTPLTLRLQLAARRLRQGQPVDLAAMEAAIRQVERLAGLVNDLLDVSRIEAGRIELRLQPVALEPVVRDLVQTFALAHPQRAIHFDPGPPLVVQADRPRLEQVVTNLIDNALKYSPGGGDVWVRLEQRGPQAVLSVRDQGIGIPQLQQKRVFLRFFRAQNARVGTWGLGLGLYICADIVERHGGRIWVESEEGRGSTFFVALPLEGPPPAHGGGVPDEATTGAEEGGARNG